MHFCWNTETVNDFTPDIICAVSKGFANVYTNFTNIYNKIDTVANELAYLVEEQNEVSTVNTKAFAKYRNCYRGRDVVIVATGSTLNMYQPIKGAVHIRVNTAYKNQRFRWAICSFRMADQSLSVKVNLTGLKM